MLVGKQLQSLVKAEILNFHHEFKDVAAHAASETLEELMPGMD